MRHLLIVGACVATSACAVLRPPVVVENRFRTFTDGGAAPPVSIAVSSAPVEKDGGAVKITQLSDRGQAALVTANAGKPPVSLKGEKDDKSVVVLDDTIKRHLVIAIQPVDFLRPGDRLDAVRVQLSVDPSQRDDWRITGWTFATNGQKIIEVGKLSDASESKLGASTGLGLGPGLPDAKLEASTTRTSTREADIKDTTDFNAAVDGNGNAWLEELAGWRENLAHNLEMDTVMAARFRRLDPQQLVSASKLSREDPKLKGIALPALPGQVYLSTSTLYVHEHDVFPICGVAHLTYRIRHIVGAQAQGTFSESDDDVVFLTGEAQASYLLAPPPFRPTWELEIGKGRRLVYVDNGGSQYSLTFASIEEVTAFRNWLRAAVIADGKLANATLGFIIAGSFKAQSKADLKNLTPVMANAEKFKHVDEGAGQCPVVLPPAKAKPGDGLRG